MSSSVWGHLLRFYSGDETFQPGTPSMVGAHMCACVNVLNVR